MPSIAWWSPLLPRIRRQAMSTLCWAMATILGHARFGVDRQPAKANGITSAEIEEETGSVYEIVLARDCSAVRFRPSRSCCRPTADRAEDIDGEIIVLNEAGLSDFGALRKAITTRQHDLYFVAFDLLHINGHYLRDMPLEERREILSEMILEGQRIPAQPAVLG